jgi:hypothetical protein
MHGYLLLRNIFVQTLEMSGLGTVILMYVRAQNFTIHLIHTVFILSKSLSYPAVAVGPLHFQSEPMLMGLFLLQNV